MLNIDESNPPPGAILRVAGPSPNGGWRVVEVWESASDQQKFASEQLAPLLQEAGVDRGEPERWEVHGMMLKPN